MGRSGHHTGRTGGRSPGRLWLVLAALLGAAVVVLPAVASSETPPSIQAYGSSAPYRYWTPSSATIGAGGAVNISNPSTEVNHGVEWRSGPETPTCKGVPVGTNETAAGKHWSGSCTFIKPGTYTFYCTVHGSEMTATITVNATGTTTSTGTTMTGSTTGYTQPATSTNSAPQPPGASSSPLAGGEATAVRVPAGQHGRSVHGSLAISQAGAGGRLEVDLLARSASLATAGKGSRVRVGKLVLTHLKAGRAPFSVALNGRARGALHRHHHLTITVRLVIQPTSGPAVTVTRSVLMRP